MKSKPSKPNRNKALKVRVPKIFKNISQRVKKIKLLNINIRKLVEISLIGIYSVLCLLIFLPQIDYQDWYPEDIGPFDYKVSLQFKPHIKTVIEKDSLDKDKQIEFMNKVNKRLEFLDIEDIYIFENDDKLEYHFPKGTEPELLSLLFSKGEIQFMMMKEPESEEIQEDISTDDSQEDSVQDNSAEEQISDPESEQQTEEPSNNEIDSEPEPPEPPEPPDPQDINSYKEVDLNPEDIKRFVITETNESTVRARILADKDTIEQWEDVAEKAYSGFAVIADQDLVNAFIMASQPPQQTKPELILFNYNYPQTVLGKIQSGPLPTEGVELSIIDCNALFPSNTLTALVVIGSILVASTAIFRYLFHNKSHTEVALKILVILTYLTLLKFFNVVFSIELILTLFTLFIFRLSSRNSKFMYISVHVLLFLLVFLIMSGPSMSSTIITAMVFIVIALTADLIAYFAGIIEND